MCVSMLDSHGRLYILCDCVFPCWTPTEHDRMVTDHIMRRAASGVISTDYPIYPDSKNLMKVQVQLGESLVMPIGPSWEPNLLPYWAPNLGPIRETRCLPQRLPNLCSGIRATLGQRQIRQSPCLALNAHSGNEWGKILVLTG